MPPRLALPILHFGFFLTGIATTMMGVLLPTLVVRWSITDAQVGSLFAVQFIAQFGGSLGYGEVSRRLANHGTVILGLFIIAAGVLGVALTVWPAPLAFVAMYGLGLGIALPATNLLVAELSAGNRASALNLLNFSWTVGALASPLIFVHLLQRQHLSLSLVLASFAAIVAVSAILVSLCHPRSAVFEEAEHTGPPSVSFEIWFLTGLLLFLYVGVENGIPGWTPLFGMRHHMLTSTSIAYALACFWGALLLGRLAAAFLWRRASPRVVTSMSLAAAAAGAALVAASTSTVLLYPGLLLAGGGLAAVFPTVVAEFPPRATGHAKAAAGIMFASAGLGGAAIPPLIGVLSTHGYGLRLGLWLMAAIVLVMLLLEQRIATQAVPEPEKFSQRKLSLH